jgi:hypothetical protein
MTVPAYASQVLQLISPLTAASYTTSATAFIDMDDAAYATIVVNISSEKNTDNTGVVLSLSEDDTSNFTSAATIVANVTVDNTEARQHTYHVDQRGRKRYLFLKVAPDATTNGNVSYGASGVKTRLKVGPSSTTGMVGVTTDSVTVV